MESFVTTFFIVLGAYLLALLGFSIIKYVMKRKDQKKANENKEVPNKEDKR